MNQAAEVTAKQFTFAELARIFYTSKLSRAELAHWLKVTNNNTFSSLKNTGDIKKFLDDHGFPQFGKDIADAIDWKRKTGADLEDDEKEILSLSSIGARISRKESNRLHRQPKGAKGVKRKSDKRKEWLRDKIAAYVKDNPEITNGQIFTKLRNAKAFPGWEDSTLRRKIRETLARLRPKRNPGSRGSLE